ncbi:MAG TPA: mechanosensitive ion channel family protein [Acidimicrobiia bacterium]|nr:mechanosensitive ion channel family protein [Acidimicrobiia bacterium]
MLLAQETTTTTTPLRDPSAEQRPLTDFIIDLFDLEPGSLTAGVLGRIIEPLLQVVLIVVVAWLLSRLLRRMVRRIVGRMKSRGGLAPFGDTKGGYVSPRRSQRLDAIGTVLSSAVGFLVWAVALFTILGSTFGLNIGPLLAGAGILGVALGFGAQDLVKDVLSGLFMLAEDQYGVGDVVDAGEATGVVEGISLRTTRIRDVTGTLWHVPNGEIRRIGNMSQEWSRALLDVRVAYRSDVDAAAEVIKAVADEMAAEDAYASLFLAPPEIWGVESLDPDSLSIRLVVKTLPGEQWAISRELRRRIKMALDRADIEIPFPQRTIWLRREGDPERSRPEARDLSAPSAATGKAGAEEGAQVTSDDQTEAPTPDDAEDPDAQGA